ncbi:MAG: 50S ribosomal protein L7/L12 [bacterium]|nr:50S ribosomal protein L7/L12 [bacterium]
MPEETKKDVPEKFKKIVEQVESMNVLDLSELVKTLEERFGVSAQMMAAPIQAVQQNTDGASSGEAVLKSVELKSGGDQKIQVIKIVKEVLNLGLKEAKDLVDSAPKVIKEGLKAEEADELKKKLEAAGATVGIK